jgi:hypothetical protein
VKVSFNRHAERELIAAAQHLHAEARLGHAFLDEYESWESRTRQFPRSCPEIAPGIHCGYLKRFKFHVTYTLRGDTMRIPYVRSARQVPLKSWTRD